MLDTAQWRLCENEGKKHTELTEMGSWTRHGKALIWSHMHNAHIGIQTISNECTHTHAANGFCAIDIGLFRSLG